MVSYASTTDIRLIIGLSTLSTDPDWIDNTTLQYYLDKACPLLLQDISILEVDESLSGNIDGINTTFETTRYPIADSDYDSTINASDIQIFGWTDSDDPGAKDSLAVTTVYAQEGKVVLTGAPGSSYDVITGTYRHYVPDSISFSALTVANAYLAGWLFLSSEYLLLPDVEAVGVHRWQFRKMPDARVLENYYRVLNLINTKTWSKKKHSTPQMIRR